jgi:hypothetical protein
VGEQVRRLRATIDNTIADLGITPSAVKRVVDTALELQKQQQLRKHIDDRHLVDGLYSVPPLTGSWQRATVGLTEKLLRPDGEPPRQMPITFDHSVAQGRDGIVLAHLGHPLVAMSTRLLRAAVANRDVGLHRVTAIVSDHPDLKQVLVGAYSRFVLVGADGIRLHEEVLHAGGWAQATGRFLRLENLTTLRGILEHALDSGTPASPTVQGRLAERWPQLADGLLAAIEWRKRDREHSLERKLAQRREAEERRINANLDQFAATLRDALAVDDEPALFSLAELEKSRDELAQYRKDRHSWEERLTGLEDERRRELAAIADRYRDPQPHLFPVAVVFVVPRQEAMK